MYLATQVSEVISKGHNHIKYAEELQLNANDEIHSMLTKFKYNSFGKLNVDNQETQTQFIWMDNQDT